MLCKIMDKWLSEANGKYYDIVLFGQVFGGRYGESLQIPRNYHIENDLLIIAFTTTEVLTIMNPSLPEIIFEKQLAIQSADMIVWGWHWYGYPQKPEWWCTKTYIRDGDQIRVIKQYPKDDVDNTIIQSTKHAVELLSFG